MLTGIPSRGVQKAVSLTSSSTVFFNMRRETVLAIFFKRSFFYVVREGDTLWRISDRMTGDPYNYIEVAEYNNIINPNLIYPRQEIIVKLEAR